MSMFIDLLDLAFAGLIALLTLVGSVAAAIRYGMRKETAPVIQRIDALADRVDTWIVEHERRHDDERAALASAFEREGLAPPDGWGHRLPRSEGRQQ